MDGTVIFARWHQCVPHLIHVSLDQPQSTAQTASRSIQSFLHSSRQSVRIFYNGPPLPLKIDHSHGRSGPQPNTWFLKPNRVLNPNCIAICSAVFAQLTTVTDRLTDSQTDTARYSVCNSRPYLRT